MNLPCTFETITEHHKCISAALPGDLTGYQWLRATSHWNDKRPRLHPNGFIQLDLDFTGATRLHVFPFPLKSAQKTSHPIHTHAFDMHSTILGGALCNKEFCFEPLSAHARERFNGPLYKLHQAKKLSKDDTILAPASAPVGYLRTLSVNTYYSRRNAAYQMTFDVFHDSIPVAPGTMTVMSKYNLQPTYAPFVAVPVGVQPDNDFRRETVDEETLWEQIKQAVLLRRY